MLLRQTRDRMARWVSAIGCPMAIFPTPETTDWDTTWVRLVDVGDFPVGSRVHWWLEVLVMVLLDQRRFITRLLL